MLESRRPSEESDSRMSSFQELVGLAQSKKLLTRKVDQTSDKQELKRRIYARLEERFHQDEEDRLRVSQHEEKVLHMLSLNMLRLKMQGKRQGQLEGFSLADSHDPRVDLQSPNTVTALRVKAHKKLHEIAEARFRETRTQIELESQKLLAIARHERSDLRKLSKKVYSHDKKTFASPEMRLRLPNRRLQFKQKVRLMLRRVLLRFACLGLKPADLDQLPKLASGHLVFPGASDLFANLRQGRVKICCQMLQENRWLAFDRDRVRSSHRGAAVCLPPPGQAQLSRSTVRTATLQRRHVDA